ncbi:MAG: hypothetical protein K9G62_08740, partial [Alphaproteobacteria bacterium]|nr:hypothetical protein [Alphaproteobacteria bacterium]
MGGLAPIVTQAAGLGAPASAVTSLLTPMLAKGALNAISARKDTNSVEAQQKLALRQLQEQQKLQQSQIEAGTAIERERLTLSAQTAEDARRTALRRAVARQRAQFGASGTGNAGGGSGQAALLGLFDESEDELRSRERLDSLRSQALDQDLSNRASLNVLQRTQLQERQKLDRIA